MGWYGSGGYPPYVPVAARRAEAQRKMEKLKKQGRVISPVRIEGKTITKSFWGKSWCENLEKYSDYENRLPRGRTYVRNGSVLDLQVKSGEVTAMVSGSEIYTVTIKINPVDKKRWSGICGDCAGSVGSLVELLQGKLSKSVMDRVCRKDDGLFPAPKEIKLSCSCPDWATMCKHVAAVMYGVGARLDEKPELLFTLRAVNENELIAKASANMPLAAHPAPIGGRALETEDVGALFGIDIADDSISTNEQPKKSSRKTQTKKSKTGEKPLAKKRRANKTGKASPKTSADKAKKSRKNSLPKGKTSVTGKKRLAKTKTAKLAHTKGARRGKMP